MTNEEKARIQNELIEDVTNEVASAATQKVFDKVIGLENFSNITKDFCEKIINKLKDDSFMVIDLELTADQKDKLREIIHPLMHETELEYVSKINKDNRTKDVVKIVEDEMKLIIEETLNNIASEINRGAIINSVAVQADTKSDKYNKIELHHSKRAGDITIPTKGVFISTNCIDIIINSIKVEGEVTKEVSEEENNG